MKTNPPITTGTRIHSVLYGGRNGTVVATHGEPMPDTVVAFPGFTTGGNAEYDIIWDNLSQSKRVPECIARGVQWRLLDEPPATPEDIEALKAMTEHHEQQLAEQAQLLAEAKQQATAALLLAHPELEPGDGAKTAAKNIRTQLKRAFAGMKFSVRSDYNSIYISWTDGPTVEEIERITRNYSLGRFDGMNDSYEYEQNRAWPFGGASYVFENRTISDGIRDQAIRLIAERYTSDCDLEQERYRCLRRTSIPAGHHLDAFTDETFPSFTTAPDAR